jgi:hypothetical protein
VRLTTLIYAALIAVAIAFFVIAMGFPPPLSPGEIGPARFPQAAAVVLIVLVAVDWLAGRKAWAVARRSDISLALGAGLYTALAIVLAAKIGFFVAAPPVMFVALWLLGERRIGLMLAYSLGFTAFLWLFFAWGLGEPLATFGT